MFDAIGGYLGLPGYSTQQWAAGQAPSFTQMNQDGGVSSQSPYNWGAINNADLPLIGWNGGNPYEQVNPNSDMEAGHSATGNGALTPEFQQFLASKGLTLGTGQGPSGYASQFYGANGQPIGQGSKYGGGSEGDIFGLATLAAGGLAGGAAAGLGAAGEGAGGALAGGGVVPSDVLAGADIGSAYGGVPAGATWASAAGQTADPALLGAASQFGGDVGTAADALGTGGSALGSAAGSTAGGGMFDSIGSGLSSIGDFAKANPGLINTGGALLNGLIGANTANRAIGAQQNAINASNAMWKPYADFGVQNGLNPAAKLLQNPSSITSDPGYQFTTQQGMQALDRSAASKGGLYSGAQLKAAQRFGQDNANTYFDKILGRYTGAAQLGATGTTNISNNLIGGGNAQAGASLYSGNVANNALNGLLGQWNYSQYQPAKPGP